MGAYNEATCAKQVVCLRCGSLLQRIVQFKYGDTWQHRNAIGDHLQWGGNDVGEPNHLLVAVKGYPEACPVCGYVLGMTCDVMVRDNTLDVVRPSCLLYEHADHDYLVVDP